MRNLHLSTRKGQSKLISSKICTQSAGGSIAVGEKFEEPRLVTFDLSQAQDSGTPSQLASNLGPYAGKIQQTCNGKLINCSYRFALIANVSGCCSTDPTVEQPIEILAPEQIIQFVPVEIPKPVPKPAVKEDSSSGEDEG